MSAIRMNLTPSIVVIDDFRPDVDAVRAFALSQKFVPGRGAPGGRTDSFRTPELKEAFEAILRRRITNWDNYEVNGSFQLCLAGDPMVFHADAQQWVGVWYLTPDAPVESGTGFYRSKITGWQRAYPAPVMSERTFKGKFLDPTAWELVDRVGNVYNRLVLWQGDLIHSGGPYFGTTPETGRLFQVFFFDAQ